MSLIVAASMWDFWHACSRLLVRRRPSVPNSQLSTMCGVGLPSSARYAATVSVRGLLVAEIQVLVPYRIHPSIQGGRACRGL